MGKQDFWDLAFITIAGIRFHPKNIPPGETLDEDELNEIDLAKAAADEMEKIRNEKLQTQE